MAHSIGTDIGDARLVLTRVLILVAFFATIYLFAFTIFGVGRSVPVRPVASYNAAQEAHCSQFVQIAQAEFGREWKRRLDPSNTDCTQQIQKAWERGWNPRQALPGPVSQPTITGETITGADERFASANAVNQKAVNDSVFSSELGNDAGDAASEARDESGMVTSEEVHDVLWTSPSDSRGNDDQNDATRALNKQQLEGRGRARNADMQRPSDEESDANENDGSHDSTSWSTSP